MEHLEKRLAFLRRLAGDVGHLVCPQCAKQYEELPLLGDYRLRCECGADIKVTPQRVSIVE